MIKMNSLMSQELCDDNKTIIESEVSFKIIKIVKKLVKRVRQYVSDRTGKDFRVKEEVNLSCEGCGAILHVNSDETMAHCPYCGATKLI